MTSPPIRATNCATSDEQDAVDFHGLQLLRGADKPTAVLLTRHRARYPKNPTAELAFLPLDGTRKPTHLPVPGISWRQGLSWSLSAGDRFIVVNRQEEQGGPVAALAYDLDGAAWYELEERAFLAMQ